MNSYFSLLRISWRYTGNDKAKYLLIYAIFILCSVATAMDPLLYGWFVDSLQREGVEVLSSAWIYIGSYIGMHVVTSVLHSYARIRERQLAFNISRNFLDDYYSKLLNLPIEWHKEHHSGSSANRLKKAYSSLKRFFQSGYSYFYTFAQFLFAFAAMIYFSPWFGLFTLILGIVSIRLIYKFDKPLSKSLHDVNEMEHSMSATLADSLTNISTVKTLCLERPMRIGVLDKFKDMMLPFRKNVVINEWKWFSVNMVIYMIYGVMVIGYCYSHYKPGEIFYLGGLVALLGFVNQFVSAFFRINVVYNEIMESHADIKSIEIVESSPVDKIQPVAGPNDWSSIEIKNLNFEYKKVKPDQEVKGLRDINIKFKKGSRIALVGESGSGKSTLLALLRGLYAPGTGTRILVDGTLCDWKNFSEAVTLFPQEPEIFENTIAYNITIGVPFTREQIIEACDLVCFSEVIKHLPNGIETQIQEKGGNLSGGQKQRLALARGVLAAQNSSIVLLDEPTSSVDTQTEIKIYNQLFDVFAGKTIIATLHNQHLLNLFDYVYVLHGGTLIKQGTYDELYGEANSILTQQLY